MICYVLNKLNRHLPIVDISQNIVNKITIPDRGTSYELQLSFYFWLLNSSQFLRVYYMAVYISLAT